jgi:3-phenylpropionate/trans-cinnamate dioxygenase ferredoxin subunit
MLSCAGITFQEPPTLSDESFRFASEAGDIPAGKTMALEIDGQHILLCHTKAGFFAIENRCTHGLAQLSAGRLRGFRIICPLHGGSFDVRDGCAKGKPATVDIRTYPVRVVDNHIEIQIA